MQYSLVKHVHSMHRKQLCCAVDVRVLAPLCLPFLCINANPLNLSARQQLMMPELHNLQVIWQMCNSVAETRHGCKPADGSSHC